MTMTPEQFRMAYPKVMAWISSTLQSCSRGAEAVSSRGFARLPHYFSSELLATTKVIVVDRPPTPPLSAIGLTQFAEFEHGSFDGITYLDTFFIKRHRANDDRLFFHELIHVVQWRLLGPEHFIAAYAEGLEKFGYRNSPLEVMAYDAEATFSSGVIFNAEKLVAQQLQTGFGFAKR